MKAMVCTKYGSPDVLHLKEVEKPTPRNNEVGIKIFATAVTSSDCLIRGSKVPLRKKSADLWSFRSGRDCCDTACQALWGRSDRGMQYYEFRIREITGSRYSH